MSKEELRPIDAAIAKIRSTYTPGLGRPSEDVDDLPLQSAETTETEVAPADDLIWPPPGLEPIHGELPRLTSQFAVAVIVLLLPLVFGALEVDPDAGSWGSVVAFMIDFVLLAFAYVRLRQLLVHALVAIESGYPRSLIWHVAADTHRDIPLILQSRAFFVDTPKDMATRLLELRTISATCALLGVLWVPVSFPFVAVAAAMGALRGVLFWIALLLPTVILLAMAAWFRLKEITAKATVRSREAVDRERAAQVSGWNRLYARAGLARSRSKNTIELKLATGGVWMALFLMLFPIALAGLTTAIPRFIVRNGSSYIMPVRNQVVNALREYRLPHDSSITPLAAGEAIHNIRFVGRLDPEEKLQKPPTRAYPRGVLPATQDLFIRQREMWTDSLFVRMRRGAITPDQRIALDSLAHHPAHAELQILARAPLVDIAAARWDFDVVDTVATYILPYGLGQLNDLALAHIARAALQFQRGDIAAAETTIKENISAGFNLLDNSLTLVDELVAGRLIRRSATALASLYELTGRRAEAERIRGMVDTIERVEGGVRSSESIEDAKRLVVTNRASRAVRWEMFALLQTAAPCMSLKSALFGRPHDAQWLKQARANLVRLPGEAQYFELLERGLTMKTKEGNERCSPRVLRSYWRAARNFY